ncbi:MAG: hypothetical protein K2H75_07725 [Muribaculaceae bacterium]|nr:hypothetical protein [Muribaculaceae bacterium]
MNTIPKKYLRPSQTVAALQHVRSWLSKGLHPLEAARQIFDVYKESKSDAQKRHLGYLMATFIETSYLELSDGCASRFGIDYVPQLQFVKGGMLYFAGAIYPNRMPEWHRSFSQYVTDFQQDREVVNTEMAKEIFEEDTLVRTFVINPEEKIFAYSDNDRRSYTFVIADGCDEDVIVDESVLSDEPPKYYTERGHFTSPVYKIKLVRQIFEYILLQIGFPYVRTKVTVMFYNQNVNLLNVDDHNDVEAWQGVSVIVASDDRYDYCIVSSIDMINELYYDFPAMREVKRMVINALKATAIAYERICHSDKYIELTPSMLRRLTDDLFINS